MVVVLGNSEQVGDEQGLLLLFSEYQSLGAEKVSPQIQAIPSRDTIRKQSSSLSSTQAGRQACRESGTGDGDDYTNHH